MKPRTGIRTEARAALVLTPALQTALKILQAPAVELREMVQQEILSNPALELEEEEISELEPQAIGGAAPEGAPPEIRVETRSGEESEPDLPEWLDWLRPEEDGAELSGGRSWSEEERTATWQPVQGMTLQASLGRQLRLARNTGPVLRAGEYLIGCLDERGYLGCALEVAAAELALPLEVMEEALGAVQGLDPTGVGARDLRECLLLQLRARGRKGSLAWRILEEQFDTLVRRRDAEISRALKATRAEVEEAGDEIRRLHPCPGRLVSCEEVRYIYPDLIVEKVGTQYEVLAQERAVPRLRVSRSCRELLRAEGVDEPARQYALARLRSARWLIGALHRRRGTMLRVMQSIVEEQKDFFERGVEGLRPLTLLQVANRLGLHESTVARVAAGKHVQTPRGIYPLRYFFSSKVRTLTGVDASSRAVRERLRLLIAEEDRTSPLADDVLAGMLERDGIRIARRTVAKYRRALRIERAELRRRLAPRKRSIAHAGSGLRLS